MDTNLHFADLHLAGYELQQALGGRENVAAVHNFPYLLCAFKSESSNTNGYSTITIPAQTWAIFLSEPFTWDKFDDTIETLYRRFYSEWLPTAGYEQVHGMEFEMYGGRDGLSYVELWFAIRKIA